MNRIVMICTEGNSSKYIYNHVSKEFNISKVFIVAKESRNTFLKRRLKKIGMLKVLGQTFFMIYQKIVLQSKASKRIEEIVLDNDLNSQDIPKDKISYINSVNSISMSDELKTYNPNLVIVNGTPIIREHILNSVDAHFLNIHVGITPKYRGVHGGYWALYNSNSNLCGVTTHLIDSGIDTGGVLEQNLITISKSDNFLTYPLLQLSAALTNYNSIVHSLLSNDFELRTPMIKESNLWYHPTLLQYLYGRIIKKIK